jgi:hypothetical protein
VKVLDYSNIPTDMATDNRGVMVYLNPELERELEQYCIDNDITRKNKDGVVLPSLGTGIVQYLKSIVLSTLPSTVPYSPSNVPSDILSLPLSDVPSNRLGTGITKAEILELIAQSNTSNILTRADVVSIARAEIDSHAERLRQRALGSNETEVTNEMMLADASTPSPLAFVPAQKVESVTDLTNWEEPIADLVSTGLSSREIAERLSLLGFTNTKGGAVSRQSIESYLSRHPDLKAIYDNARKKGD